VKGEYTVMNHRTHGWLLLLTAAITAFLLFLRNGVGDAFPLSDGGSHYVTGLLAYDWLHAGHLTNPMQYGTEYFKHLPYIGLLLWPPLFYGIEMVAFSIFGPSIQVALVLCTAIFAVGAAVLAVAVRKSGQSLLVAHLAAATILTSSLIQETQRNLLIDGLVSILSLAATVQFAYYLVKPSWRGAWLTGLLAVLAFYAKGNGVQLGLVFPLLALMLRRPAMLFDRRTLAMVAACIVITGPWLYVTAGLSAQGFLYTFSSALARQSIAASLAIGSAIRTPYLLLPVSHW
jgi:4-amino-4-deoxy-L-arabinose transferase-like glycosyltransferase